MKLAVFGDSFAPVQKSIPGIPFGWWSLLKEKLNCDELACFGMGGSSVYYSYKNFLEYHSKYDKIIFLMTSYRRPYITDLYKTRIMFDKQVKPYLDKMVDDYIKLSVNYLDSYHNDLKDAMYDSIKSIRGDDVLVYPCFHEGIAKNMSDQITEKHPLFDLVVKKQFDYFHSKYDIQNKDERVLRDKNLICHVCEEMHPLIADLFYNIMVYDNYGISAFDKIEFKHEPEYYYHMVALEDRTCLG